MELNKYVGKVIKVELSKPEGYYYVGTCEAVDDDSLFLIDMKGKAVSIRSNTILTVVEVGE